MNFIKKFIGACALVVAIVATQGCTRITDGEVGVRVSTTGTIEKTELGTGYHQTLFGNVLEFPVRDITFQMDNLQPLTVENSALADFDANIVYSVNPQAVAELYSTKARSFHGANGNDVYLMYNYVGILSKNAAYKVVRQFKSLEAADNRATIEAKMKEVIQEQLKAEKLENSITVSAIQIRNILPNAEILKSSTDLVKSQNELKVKENEIKIAEAEAKRQAALAQNAGQSIAYMEAQAKVTIAEAIRAGKVQTIIVPSNMTSLMLGK